MESILTSIKLLLGMDEDYTEFDSDIIMHINSVFVILTQLGVGPSKGFRIEDSSATWYEYTQDNLLIESVKTYIHLKVKLIFDPPSSSAVIASMERLISEFEWRLNVAVDPADTFERR